MEINLGPRSLERAEMLNSVLLLCSLLRVSSSISGDKGELYTLGPLQSRLDALQTADKCGMK